MSKLKIAGYVRISVDIEKDTANTSIENQKNIILDYVKEKFPDAELDFFSDRDKSGYTFAQRDGYQEMRPMLLDKTYDILIVKDLSRLSRRTGEGLVEVETLRDAGLRLISVQEWVDYSLTHLDDWDKIRFTFIMNENPVTDTSKKIKRVIDNRQKNGKWVCAVPYGYYIVNPKTMVYRIDEETVPVIKKIYELYLEGYGYRKIAEYLTSEKIPTPRMVEKKRRDEKRAENGDLPTKIKTSPVWAVPSIQEILTNDFYIGTLRQRKYTRAKINGKDVKVNECENLVFENAHEPIIDVVTFAKVQEQMKLRTKHHYRGEKKYDTHYSGFLFCGDCGSPMFSRSTPRLAPQYICGKYHKQGKSYCTAHTVRVDLLDAMLKKYVEQVMLNSKSMISKLEKAIKDEPTKTEKDELQIKKYKDELEIKKEGLSDQVLYRTEEIARAKRKYTPDVLQNEIDKIFEKYDKAQEKLEAQIKELEERIEILSKKRNTTIRTNRVARTALEVFHSILEKDALDKNDVAIIVDRIDVWDDNIVITLKADITMLLETGKVSKETLETSSLAGGTAVNFKWDTKSISNATVVQTVQNQKDKSFSVNVLSSGDPLEIYTGTNGEVIFRKYSPIGELAEVSASFADAVASATKLGIVITDRDHCISASGVSKKEVIDMEVSSELEQIMEDRQPFIYEEGREKISLCGNGSHIVLAAYPIISAGDLCGAVVLVPSSTQEKAEPSDLGLARVGSVFLGKQLED